MNPISDPFSHLDSTLTPPAFSRQLVLPSSRRKESSMLGWTISRTTVFLPFLFSFSRCYWLRLGTRKRQHASAAGILLVFSPNEKQASMGDIKAKKLFRYKPTVLCFNLGMVRQSTSTILRTSFIACWGVTYKTAWFLAHRIRYAMSQPSFAAKLKGVVEVN